MASHGHTFDDIDGGCDDGDGDDWAAAIDILKMLLLLVMMIIMTKTTTMMMAMVVVVVVVLLLLVVVMVMTTMTMTGYLYTMLVVMDDFDYNEYVDEDD